MSAPPNSAETTTNATTVETRRTISPYDLNAADNPGAVISHPLLKGSNYDEWACGMKTALCSRKKFGFLDGSISRPEEGSADLEDWWTIQALLVSWIKMTIDPTLRTSISHRDVAKDLWDNLKKRFSVTNGPRIQQLKSELACCKQRGLAIEAYYGKLNRIWDNMAQYRPLRVCKCGKCECDLGTLQEQDREEVYNVVRQEEDLKTPVIQVEDSPQVLAHAVQTKSRFNTARIEAFENAVVCKHCQRPGHASNSCFAVVGYPEWWGDRPRSRVVTGRGRGAVSTGRGRNTNYANAVHIPAIPNQERANYVVTDKDRDGVSGLNDDQWQFLMKLLNNGGHGGASSSNEKLSGKFSSPSWILDTGASHHLTGNFEILTNVRNMDPVLVVLADGRERITCKEGTVVLGSNLILKSVFYVEEFQSDLVSVGQLMDENGCVVQMDYQFLVIQDRVSRTMIGAGKRDCGTFRFCRTELVASVTTQDAKAYELWHNRMGHPSARVVGSLPNVSVSFNSEISNKACDVCLRAKQTRSCFPISDNKTSSVFELIHVDLWGPYRTPSSSGARYFLTVVDDFSRSVWIYLQNDKTETSMNLKSLVSLAERQFGQQVKRVRSDNGTEFMSMSNYFRSQGIVHETSCVGTPQQNGRVERKHRHILNVARALRFQSNLPISFWGECILTAGYIINRTPSSVMNGATPYEKLHGTAPDYEHVKVFGSLCYAHNQGHRGDKFAPRSRKCVFVGYPYGKKAWRLYDLDTQEFFVSRDVVFCETDFPFAETAKSVSGKNQEHEEDELWKSILLGPTEEEFRGPMVSPIVLAGPTPTNSSPQEIVSSTTTDTSSSTRVPPQSDSDIPSSSSPSPTKSVTRSDSASSSSDTTPPSSPIPVDSIQTEQQPAVAPVRRGQRPRNPPVKMKDYKTYTAQTRLLGNSNSLYPIANYVTNTRFSATHRAFLVSITDAVEPKTYNQAIKSKVWTNAMGSEVGALEENNTWTIEDLPPGKKAIGSKWVYKIKYNSDGTIERYKARLVALGNSQVEGIDYGETFAPVARMQTVRMFLEVAAGNNWPVHQMDVHNAFLHGDLTEEVYMKPPPGYFTNDEKKVCRLHKSLYGLKQAPRCWFAKLTTALREYGFVQSLSDYSLFSFEKSGIRINILIYVDDMIVSSNSEEALGIFKGYLASCFKMKDLGPLKYFLGIEVSRSCKGFYLSQRKYALDIVEEAGLLGSKPATFPLEQNHKLALSTSPLLLDPEPYRRLIGKLIYLAATRPDLAYCVHILAQFMQSPREDHWQAALRVVRYLKGNPGQGILLQAKKNFQITGWCDSDWSSCPLTRRSTTGYFVQVGDSPVSWKTKKQDTVSMSSAEAEYRAMAFITKELLWLKRVLQDLGVSHDQPMRLCCDNKSAIYIATNPVFHERTKHIENDCHFVRDEIQKCIIAPAHVDSCSQLADIFTKPLGKQSFEDFRLKLGILNLHAPV
ncbi:Integrase catalytic core [Arabidopsis thaliana x Arabidopsis arenosa]|uniref:Integrase catalytic core n=1 Tax=Arabidopsis thaliana x Arabidopsis arenosa TaxID=1240361 RepID=A0A8T1Y8U6_9BRAS|nr:Integrase catalytic core [Arabidopsis thaliana x Arabidopsis arenosa]